MKALSEMLWIVAVSVVVIVVAIVLLAIFANVIPLFGSITEFQNYCTTKAIVTCPLGYLPPDWTFEVNVGGTKTTCAEKFAGKTCSDFTTTPQTEAK